MKQTFPILFIMSMLLISSCGERIDIEESTSFIGDHTFTLSASMPAEDSGSTRATATQIGGTKDIELRWKENDSIQLYFKCGNEIITGEKVAVKNISDDRKNADIKFEVPATITGKFDLYGVHGVDSKLIEGAIFLDARPTNMSKLNEISLPIYFVKKDLDNKKPEINDLDSVSKNQNVRFNHYGALQVIAVKNTTDQKYRKNISHRFRCNRVTAKSKGWKMYDIKSYSEYSGS